MFGFFKKKEAYKAEGQNTRIKRLMDDGRWRTLAEISKRTKDPETSVSAQLRHLRKPQFGGFTIEKRRKNGGKTGPYEYRLVNYSHR